MKDMLMSWLSSIGVGVITAIISGALGGFVANLTVGWQRISSREGGSGYFVFYSILLAAAIGFLIGVVVSRVLAHGGPVPMLKSVGISNALIVAGLGVIGVLTRLNADVAPTFEGEELLLAVEVSWPEAQAPALTEGKDPPYLILASGKPGAVRGQQYGMLWPRDMRHENGRVIVPGAVEVWTERGQRLLSANIGSPSDESLWLQVPLPRRPGRAQREWSEWLPKISGAEPAALGGLRYRYRIVKRNEAVRTQSFGPFTIGTMLRSVSMAYADNGPHALSATAAFAITHLGKPVRVEGTVGERDYFVSGSEPADSIARYEEINAVAVVPGETPALVVQVDASYGGGYTYLLTSNGGAVRTTYLSHVQPGQPLAHRLASVDSASATRQRGTQGMVDDLLFAEAGPYVTASAVFDTRTRAIHRVPLLRAQNEIDSKPPLGLAPDASRYARLRSIDTVRVLDEVTIATGATRTIQLTGAPSPTGNYIDVDRAWFDYYFAWEADGSGAMHVVPRKTVGAMPHRGKLLEQPGYREYRVAGGDETLHEAFLQFLERELQAKRLPSDDGGASTSTHVVIGNDTLSVNNDESAVTVYALNGAHSVIVATIARKFDAALATRRFDQHFAHEPQP